MLNTQKLSINIKIPRKRRTLSALKQEPLNTNGDRPLGKLGTHTAATIEMNFKNMFLISQVKNNLWKHLYVFLH